MNRCSCYDTHETAVGVDEDYWETCPPICPCHDEIYDKSNRPNWDTYFLNIAKAVSLRASCPRASSGVVLVKDRRIVATGYNGAPPGYSECITKGCILVNNHCMRAIHGERNAIEWGEKFDVDFEDTIMYEYFEAIALQSQANYYPPKDEKQSFDVFGCKSCKELIMMKKIHKVIVQYGNGKQVVYTNE